VKDKLAPYKYPRQIEFVADLPKTATGKIQRFKLREQESRCPMSEAVAFVDVDWAGRPVRIEHAWIGPERRPRPLIVFLHEGLGSLAMWKDFPQRCARRGLPRPGVFAPGLRPLHAARGRRAWGLDFMHRQAHEVLPACWRRWASTRGSALAVRPQRRRLDRAAVRGAFPAGAWPAPWCWRRTSWSKTCRWPASPGPRGLRDHRPAPAPGAYHDDPDSAFWGWNDIWLHPPFSSGASSREIAAIRCPLLAVQGLDDEYGTLEQIGASPGACRRHTVAGIAADCGHSPAPRPARSRDRAATAFFKQQTGDKP
jgi:hypothetical protein